MIGAVVLAAGRSGRMGPQKLLLPLHGQPIITGIVDELLRSPLERIVVVVGRNTAQIQNALAGRVDTFAQNPDPAGDMLSSVRCGLRVLPAACEAVLVVLGDQPGITQGLVAGLVRAFRETRRGIIVPAQAGRRGHPLLFAAHFCDEILTHYDGIGLHGLLAAHPAEILEHAVPSAMVLDDVDTPEDYARLVKSTPV